MEQAVLGLRMALSMGIGPAPVYASATAEAAVREAEQITRVAAGVTEPGAVSRPARLSEMLAVDALDRDDVHAVLGDIAVAQARLYALQAAAVARLDELTPRQQHLPGGRAAEGPQDRPDDWVADEVACVLQVAVGTASRLVAGHPALHDQFPAVWAALADGLVDVRRAQVLVDALTDGKRSAGGGIDDEVVDGVAARGLAWIREGVGPTTLAGQLGAAVLAADPAEAGRRAERRRRRASVTTVAAGDGLAGLRAELLSAEDAAAMQARVDALASAWRRSGDQRPIGVLRVESLMQLLLRPWEALPAEVAGTGVRLTVRVDLSDLDGGGALGATGLVHGRRVGSAPRRSPSCWAGATRCG